MSLRAFGGVEAHAPTLVADVDSGGFMESRRSLARALIALTMLAFTGTLWPASAQQPEVVEQSGPAGHISITIESGRITASIRDSSFGSVLRELAAQTGAAFVAADDVEVETSRMSAQVPAMPLDEGLRLLLNNYDVFFYYGSVGNGPSLLRGAWIYRKGAAAYLRPVPPEACGSTRELHANLTDADPVVRARAYEAIMSRPDNESRELVIHALRGTSEPDDAVRERILAVASATEMRLPADLLTDLARWDRSAGIRLNALNALALEPTGKEAARAALTDASARVRKRAREILAELEARSR